VRSNTFISYFCILCFQLCCFSTSTRASDWYLQCLGGYAYSLSSSMLPDSVNVGIGLGDKTIHVWELSKQYLATGQGKPNSKSENVRVLWAGLDDKVMGC
jgi:hypothetical protein